MEIPIACTLTQAELLQRRRAVMNTFRTMRVTVTELPDGYAYSFAASSEALLQVAQLVDMERQCCPFLTFKIVVEAAREAMRLEVTGPKEGKAVIANYFDCDNA